MQKYHMYSGKLLIEQKAQIQMQKVKILDFFFIKMVLLGSRCHNLLSSNPVSSYCSLCDLQQKPLIQHIPIGLIVRLRR